MKKSNVKALLPIGVFLVLYLGLGILFEYVLKIGMGFYNIPIVVIFVIALLVACVQNPSVKFDEKLEITRIKVAIKPETLREIELLDIINANIKVKINVMIIPETVPIATDLINMLSFLIFIQKPPANI